MSDDLSILEVDKLHQTIRIDNDTSLGSVYDVIKLICDCTVGNCSLYFNRLDEGLHTKCMFLKINGKGRETPCASHETLVEIIWVLPGKRARQFARLCAQNIVRMFKGDLSLCDEIEARHMALWNKPPDDIPEDFVVVADGAIAADRLLTSYHGKMVVYLLKVFFRITVEERTEIIWYHRFGYTDEFDVRFTSHSRTFYKVKVLYLVETFNNKKIERLLKHELNYLGAQVGASVNGVQHNDVFMLPNNYSIEAVKDLLIRLVQDNPMLCAEQIEIEIRRILEKEITRRIEIEHETKRLIHAKEQEIHLAMAAKKEEEATKRYQSELEMKYRYAVGRSPESISIAEMIPEEILPIVREEPHVARPVVTISTNAEAIIGEVSPDTLSQTDTRPVETPILPAPAVALTRHSPTDLARQDDELPSIDPNRSRRNGVAEINPQANSVIKIHAKRADIINEYRMCGKTLKNKIENNEIFLRRRWIDMRTMSPGDEFYDVIMDNLNRTTQ